MARNGSGTYSLPEAAFVYDTVISETAMNSDLSDIATALTGSIAKDGQTTPTANLPMGTYKLTGLGAGSAATDSANLGQVQAEAFIWAGTAGGTKNALTLTVTPAITAYAAGQRFRFKSGATQSDAVVTIAVSGLVTKAGQMNGAAMSATIYLEASKWYEAYYTAEGVFEISKLGVFASIFAQTLMDDGSASDARTTLGLGTMAVQNSTSIAVTGGTLSGVPIDQQSKIVAYTTVLADGGKHILHPTADNNARTFTIDSNANVAYPIGTTITFVNQINTVTIAITSDTMTFYPVASTGSRTLAAYGQATAIKVASTSWVITGVGLT